MSELFSRVKEIPTPDVVRTFFPGLDLKRDGSGRHKALCPFHAEETPSFTVYEAGFKCFGCGAAGSNIDLILKAGLVSSPLDAAKMVAEKFGIKVEERKTHRRKESVNGGTAERSPEGLTVARLAEAKNLDERFLKNLGLRNVKCEGQPAVLIPYYDTSGEVHAFRYRLALNGTGGPRFKWRSGDRVTLYGLDRLQSVKDAGWVLLVEGESDCWAAWQAGLPALGVPGKTTWRSEWAKQMDGLPVFLWQEPDAEDLSERLAKDLANLWIIEAPEDVKDISEAHIQGRNLPELIDELKVLAIPAEKISRDKTEAMLRSLQRKAARVLRTDDPLSLVEDALRSIGYGGDIKPALITYAAATSRVLKMRPGSMPVHLLLLGIASSGKSYTLGRVRDLLPAMAVHEIDAGSPRILIYDDSDLVHRIIIFGESDSLPAGEDNPAASAVRNLLQEHRLRYSVTIRDKETGAYIVHQVVKPGPTVLITTAVRRLGSQLDSRFFILEVPDDVAQVRQALATQAKLEIEGGAEPDPALIAFQEYLQALAPWDVIVPYADQLADKISKAIVEPRVTRDFQRILSMIKAIAIIRHKHRQSDDKGRLAVTIDDYRTVYSLVNDMYTTTVSGATKNVREVVETVEHLSRHGSVTVSMVMKHLALGKATASRRVNVAIKNGWLCNREERKGYPADLAIGEPLPDVDGLPDPESLRDCSTVSGDTGSSGRHSFQRPLLESSPAWEAEL